MDDTPGSLPVETLIGDIEKAITQANLSTNGTSDLRVRSVNLVLKVFASASAGGHLDFRVPIIGTRLKIGRRVTRQDTHTIDLTLVPPETALHEVRGAAVQEAVVDAVETIRNILREAAAGEHKFRLEQGSVEITFVVTDHGTISLGVEGELQEEVTHTMRLVIGP